MYSESFLDRSDRWPQLCSHSDEERIAVCRRIADQLSKGLPVITDTSFSSLVRPSDNEVPAQRWFQYREGFTVELCRRLFGNSERLIIDPFCGFGSTLVASRAQGVPSIGLDVNPLAVFVTRVKTRRYSPACIEKLEKELKKI